MLSPLPLSKSEGDCGKKGIATQQDSLAQSSLTLPRPWLWSGARDLVSAPFGSDTENFCLLPTSWYKDDGADQGVILVLTTMAASFGNTPYTPGTSKTFICIISFIPHSNLTRNTTVSPIFLVRKWV